MGQCVGEGCWERAGAFDRLCGEVFTVAPLSELAHCPGPDEETQREAFGETFVWS